MMKQTWVRPQAMAQVFEANEYVAFCVTADMECALPGNGTTNGQRHTYGDYNGLESGYWWELSSDGSYNASLDPNKISAHGFCGSSGYTVKFDGSTWMEPTANGKPIYNVNVSTAAGVALDVTNPKPGTYEGTWNTKTDYYEFTHYGRVVISYLDAAHPNRS